MEIKKRYYLDPFFYSLMLGMGETFFCLYSLKIGHSPFQAGILSSIPLAIGGIFQLLVPKYLNLLKSYSSWTLFGATTQAIIFLLILVLEKTIIANYWVLFLLVTVYWIMGLATVPAWSAWISKIIPMKSMKTFLANRNIFIALGTVIGLITSGSVLHFASTYNYSPFLIIFTLSFLARMLSTISLYFHEKVTFESFSTSMFPYKSLKELENFSEIMKFIYFVSIFKMGVFFSASFFTPFMLEKLKFSYFQYSAILMIAFTGRIISNKILAKKSYSLQKVFLFSAFGVAIIPLMWCLGASFKYLIFLEVFTGFLWGGFELCVLVSTFESTSSEKQPILMSLYNLYHTLFITFGCLMGALCFYLLKEKENVYQTIFLTSTSLRLFALLFFPASLFIKIRKNLYSPFISLLSRPLGLRPNTGNISRPLWFFIKKVKREDKED
jgi:predicted MFS family arabinose efflux permease